MEASGEAPGRRRPVTARALTGLPAAVRDAATPLNANMFAVLMPADEGVPAAPPQVCDDDAAGPPCGSAGGVQSSVAALGGSCEQGARNIAHSQGVSAVPGADPQSEQCGSDDNHCGDPTFIQGEVTPVRSFLTDAEHCQGFAAPSAPDQGAEMRTSSQDRVSSPRRRRSALRLAAVQATQSKGCLRFDAKLGAVPIRTLLDSGAESMFVSEALVKRHGLTTFQFTDADAVDVILADGSKYRCNQGVRAPLRLDGHSESGWEFRVVPMHAAYDLIIGMPWLHFHNPLVDWKLGTATMNPRKGMLVLKSRSTPRLETIMSAAVLEKTLLAGKAAECWLTVVRAVEAPSSAPDQASVNTWAEETARQIMADYADVLQEKLPEGLPPQRSVDHVIQVEPGAAPPCKRPYKLSPEEDKELYAQLVKALELGHIRPSSSPYGAPVLFVKKKTGEYRMVVDYRGLNKITVKNMYPMPTIDQLLDRLHGAKVFTSLDLTSGYNQIRVAEQDIHKTAFRTRYGHYEYLVMPFGLCNAPATFQRMVNDLLQPLGHDYVLVYLDDILIYSKTPEQHDRHVRKVLDLLRANQLYAKKTKCSFFKKHTGFLGYIITDQGTQTDPKKIQAVQDWPTPKTVTDVRRFHGFAAWYGKFVKDFSTLAAPLNDLNSGSGNDIIGISLSPSPLSSSAVSTMVAPTVTT